MQVIIDRLENNYAVVELPNGTMVDMPIELLPLETQAGSVIDILLNTECENKNREAAKKRMNKLFHD